MTPTALAVNVPSASVWPSALTWSPTLMFASVCVVIRLILASAVGVRVSVTPLLRAIVIGLVAVTLPVAVA